MIPFVQVVDGEMFLTYALTEDDARAAFVGYGLPEDGNVRRQPQRTPDEFVYTRNGRNVTATVVGLRPSPGSNGSAEDTFVDASIDLD